MLNKKVHFRVHMLGVCLCTLERWLPIELWRLIQNLPILLDLENDFEHILQFKDTMHDIVTIDPRKFVLPPYEFVQEKVGPLKHYRKLP